MLGGSKASQQGEEGRWHNCEGRAAPDGCSRIGIGQQGQETRELFMYDLLKNSCTERLVCVAGMV
jgi:hypothetical protein